MNKIVKKLADWLVVWCENNGRKWEITGGPTGKTVYLVRYIVFKSRFFSIFIHRFMRSDADAPHDHPWSFFTYIISGSYVEHFYDRKNALHDGEEFKSYWKESVISRKTGSIAYRRAGDIHRVEVEREYDKVEDAPYTLCVLGPRVREWGFWVNSFSFMDWRKYLSITPNDPRTEGSE